MYRVKKFRTAIKLLITKVFNNGKLIVDVRRSLIARNVTIDLRRDGVISIGSVIVESGTNIASSGKLLIGENVFINRNCNIVCRDTIRIGDECFFGPNVCIYDHDHMFGEHGKRDGFTTSPVQIGKNTWIGASCVILKGTQIGENCVIGAGSVIKGIIPSNSTVKMNTGVKISRLENREC
jgi:acetyltransferase-like isoleucine patch superfamily enzyme